MLTSPALVAQARYARVVDREEAIDAAWQRVVNEWDDEQTHRAFLMLCASIERLDEAGRRYREVCDQDPARRTMAEAQIERVLGLAMQKLSSLQSERHPRSTRKKLLLVATGVSGTLIAIALWTLLRSASSL